MSKQVQNRQQSQAREPGPAVKVAPEADRRMRVLAGLGLVGLAYAAAACRMVVPGVLPKGLELLGVTGVESVPPWKVVQSVADTVVREFGE